MPSIENKPFRLDDINGSYEALTAFGEDVSLIIARPRKRSCCNNFWFTIPDGFYGIVTRHGVQVDFEDMLGNRSCVWPSGLHIGVSVDDTCNTISLFTPSICLTNLYLFQQPPWLKVSHLVTKQNIVMTTSIKQW